MDVSRYDQALGDRLFSQNILQSFVRIKQESANTKGLVGARYVRGSA